MAKYESYKETEQEIKIQAQKQQIEKMTVRMGQLEEQYKNKEKHMMGEIQRLLHIDEMARGLCQKILDKDSREIVLGSSHSWSSMSSEQMIESATKSYKAYCEKRTKDMQKIGKYASELSEKYEDLLEKHLALKKTLEAYEQAESMVSDGRRKQIKDALNGKTKIGDVEVATIEEPDDEDEEKTTTVKTSSKNPTAKEKEKKETTSSTPYVSEGELEKSIRLLIPAMSDAEKQVLKLIGDGMSVSVEIKNAIKSSVSVSTSARCLSSLTNDGYIECVPNISFPGTKGSALVRLTKKGRVAYKLITGDEPNEPEMDRIRRVHATYEHGYGIRACARLLDKSGRYKTVNMFPDKIKAGDGTIYIPDLVCMRIDENGNKAVEYFEFERCKQKNVEYFTKFGKMSSITEEINVIVANPSEHDKMQRLLAAWANAKADVPSYAHKTIRLTNYNRIKDCIEKKKPFSDWWYMTDFVKDFKPPLGYDGPLGEGA